MRGRMYGSTERKALRTTSSPSPGSRTSTSASSKSLATGSPRGRATRRHSRLVSVTRRNLLIHGRGEEQTPVDGV